jgi:hypothetical protein
MIFTNTEMIRKKEGERGMKMKACKIGLCFCALAIGLLMPSVTFAQDDHGDDAATATAITTDGTLYDGELEVGSDKDYFSFNATAGFEYILETSQLGVNCDTEIRLFNTDGTTQIDYDDDGGVGLASRIDWVAMATDTFYVSVEPLGPTSIGTYKFSVRVDQPQPLAGICEPCNGDADCESGNCGVPVSGGGPNRCIPAGSSTYECPTGDGESSGGG